MRALFVVHIGETVGHLVRALAVADEMAERGVSVEIACSRAGSWLLEEWNQRYSFHALDWSFSHNSLSVGSPSAQHTKPIIDMQYSLMRVLREVRPDVVIGFPGIFSAQVCRTEGVQHFSVLHGPYLSPIVQLADATVEERAVLNFGSEFFHSFVNGIYDCLHATLGLQNLTYSDYLLTEQILVPQPSLGFPNISNLHVVPFIRASFGPELLIGDTNQRICYITFGSGNPCGIEEIVHAAEDCFERVCVTAGFRQVQAKRKDTVVLPFAASASLASRVDTVVSHGGIGTVGTFAEAGARQLIIPTEVDQATMAVHAPRAGLASVVGLSEWASRPMLGRRLPHLSKTQLHDAMVSLHEAPNPPCVVASGAAYIAEFVLGASVVGSGGDVLTEAASMP